METSWINTTVFYNNFEGVIERKEYEWRGKSPYISVYIPILLDLGYSPDAKEIQIGPYKLFRIEDEPQRDSALFVRKDRLYKIRVFFHRFSRIFDLFYRRIILTLAVWKLAEVHHGWIPSWRDILLIKFLAKKFKKGKNDH